VLRMTSIHRPAEIDVGAVEAILRAAGSRRGLTVMPAPLSSGCRTVRLTSDRRRGCSRRRRPPPVAVRLATCRGSRWRRWQPLRGGHPCISPVPNRVGAGAERTPPTLPDTPSVGSKVAWATAQGLLRVVGVGAVDFDGKVGRARRRTHSSSDSGAGAGARAAASSPRRVGQRAVRPRTSETRARDSWRAGRRY